MREKLRDEIACHENERSGDRDYEGEFRVPQLAEALDKLAYPENALAQQNWLGD